MAAPISDLKTPRPRGVFNCLRAWSRSRSGNVSMLMGLLMLPLVAAVGLAVDLGRAYRVRTVTQAALDSAVLAAGRAAQTNSTSPLTSASTAASAYYNVAKPTDVVSSTMTFAGNANNTEFTLTATNWVQTPFLGALFGVVRATGETGAPSACAANKFSCLKLVSTATASIAAGGNGGSNLEVSLMLDVTGSMDGSKITTLIEAANDLIDTVVWADQSKYTSRVAIAPFAPSVNVGATYYTAITGQTLSTTTSSCGWTWTWWGWQYQCNTTTSTDAPCVVDRSGTQAYTDAAPGSGTWLKDWNTATSSSGTSCTPSQSIVALTSDKTVLHNAINALDANGGTAGALGTAFAWYLLSPNWASVWGTSSAPASYADLTTYNSNGSPKLQKIAVLMTDGDYNIQFGQNANVTNVNNAALSLCTNMKAKGIIVYTVGFQLSNNTAKNLLKSCATSTDYFYDASSEDLLLQAFRDISLKISSLRLTN